MKIKQSHKRWRAIIQLIQAGQKHLEMTEPLDPIDIITVGDNFIKEIRKEYEPKGGQV